MHSESATVKMNSTATASLMVTGSMFPNCSPSGFVTPKVSVFEIMLLMAKPFLKAKWSHYPTKTLSGLH